VQRRGLGARSLVLAVLRDMADFEDASLRVGLLLLVFGIC
jgi:hypothetical protein